MKTNEFPVDNNSYNSYNSNNNVCLKENAGAECVYNQEVVPKIVKIMKVEKNQKIRYFFLSRLMNLKGRVCEK